MSMSRIFIQNGNQSSRVQRAMHFVAEDLPTADDIFDLAALWGNDRIDILYQKLNNIMPECPIENKNHLQIGTRIHHLMVALISPLLPKNWKEEINLFPLISNLIKTHSTQMVECAKFFESKKFLATSETDIIGEIKKFLKIVPNILPAFALCDDMSIKEELRERGMFSISFDALKTYYQNSFEIIASCCDCLIALNGIYYRGDFMALPITIGDIKTLNDLEKSRSKIKKVETFLPQNEAFSKLLVEPLHSHVRNAIGHTSVTYDPLTQLISFEDKHKGKIHVEQIYLTEFANMCIDNFCTLAYLLETVYQLRKFVFIGNGDVPDVNYTRLILSGKLP